MNLAVVRIQHSGPDVPNCEAILSAEAAKCPCGHTWATFNEDGSVTFGADVEYDPITLWGVSDVVEIHWPEWDGGTPFVYLEEETGGVE